ncbi:MAG: hypothetical protein AAGJ54_08195 [Planctomycetota bacterium]
MSDNSKIEDGLATRSTAAPRLDQGSLVRVTSAGTAPEGETPLTAESLSGVIEGIERRSDELVATAGRIEREVADATEKAKAAAKEAIGGGDSALAGVHAESWRKYVRQEADNARATATRDLDLGARLETLSRRRAELQAFRDEHRKPARVLARAAMENPRRAQLMAALGPDVGSTELVELARRAHATNDLVLASIVTTLNARLPKAKRRLDHDDLADRFVGERCREVSGACERGLLAIDRAAAKIREALTGKAESSLSKIDRGLRAKAAG